MAKRRSDRYATGRMFAEDLADVVEGRPPRHAEGWVAPVPGEGTVVAAREPGFQRVADDPLELEPLDDETPRGHAGSLLWLGLALSALTAVLFRSPFWLDRIASGLGVVPAPAASAGPSAPFLPPAPSSVPITLAPAVASSPEAAEVDSPTEDVIVDDDDAGPMASPGPSADGSEATSAETPPIAAASAEPSPGSPSPIGQETAAEAPSPSAPSPSPHAARPPRPMARFAITFEHGIQHGTLRVLVDRKVVLSQRLTSRVTKDLLLFKLRSGVVRDTLHVAPGKRRIRVEVRTPDDVRTKETVATFRVGHTRRLKVTIGRLRGNLTLEWR
jgi:hypothetical protein